ncbi:hypothetical protein N1851_021852 [Merluccius polli]|uniref:Uncharacterized protein n=1 Tax=Merluccius polli TaxID=89951 RepID=A0AA47NXS8_MERPO|nr:hypothetical protein N1851_021852 [Merluccius polli]
MPLLIRAVVHSLPSSQSPDTLHSIFSEGILAKLGLRKLPLKFLGQCEEWLISYHYWCLTRIKDKGRLQHVIRSAEKVIGCNLPSLQDLYTSRTLRRAGKIVADPSHPGHKLFESLPSGRRLRSIRTKTSRHKNSFFPSATSLINKART